MSRFGERSWRRLGSARPQSPVRSFGELPGRLLVVCGLHGGAGTTTVAAAFAVAAAGISPHGTVLAVEADARAGELAARLGAASALPLDALAHLVAAGRRPDAPFVERADGLRVIATEPSAIRRAADVADVLAEARRAHGLVVVDAGPICADAASMSAAAADVVLWTAHTDRLGLAAQRLRGRLARNARQARWLLAVRGGRVSRAALAGVRDDLAARITVPADLGQRPAAAEPLLAAVLALLS